MLLEKLLTSKLHALGCKLVYTNGTMPENCFAIHFENRLRKRWILCKWDSKGAASFAPGYKCQFSLRKASWKHTKHFDTWEEVEAYVKKI